MSRPFAAGSWIVGPDGLSMNRFVIGCDVAVHLAFGAVVVPADRSLLAPTLMRSQFLAFLYGAVRRREIDRASAARQLDYLRSLKIRWLGDRVLQRVAWEIADRLDWPDTYQAEYLALTRLQADAFVTLDKGLAKVATGLVPLASLDELIGKAPHTTGRPAKAGTITPSPAAARSRRRDRP